MSKTNLAASIDMIDELVRRYNEGACSLLADPQILAYILINTMSEFENWSIAEVIKVIDDVSVKKDFIDPGYSNMGKIAGNQTVDIVPGEGEIRYDIRFKVNIEQKSMRILINLEAQKTSDAKKLGYHIENRIQYYLARMISAQKNTEFFNDQYDDIKKVVSIWICMDSEIDEDEITGYRFRPYIIYGNNIKYKEFDKMEAYIVRIRKTYNIQLEESKNKLINMLETLFSRKKKTEVKKILHNEHGMIMEVSSTNQEVDKMCNLGEALYESAYNDGEKQGIEQGRIQLLISMIEKKLKKGKSYEDISNELELDLDELKNIMSGINVGV